MRRRLLLAPVLALATVPSPALAQSGGATAPAGGGHAYGQPAGAPARSARPVRLRATRFRVSPGSVAVGAALRFGYRIDGRVARVRVKIALVPAAGRRARTLRLGSQPTGRALTHAWTPRAGELAPGHYVARLEASGAHGARLRRGARASGRSTLEVVAPPPAAAPGTGVFPIQGAYDFGGADARFGASRTGHAHRGQDVAAAEGTPLVSPRAGLVYWRAYQAAGAGHYLVVRADDGRDYVFMHIQDGSLLVQKGQSVRAGQRLGSVGNTGASFGAHLHFEIWPDGWYASDASKPIDPLPTLQAWAAG